MNPLINKTNVELEYDRVEIDSVKKMLETYLDSIDSDLLDYVEFGIFVESIENEQSWMNVVKTKRVQEQ